MKGLTIHQPWSWAILHAGKRVENRGWATSYRGPLAIHAGLNKDRLAEEYRYDWKGQYHVELPPIESLVFGAIVGVADLVECVNLMRPIGVTPEQVKWLKSHLFTEGPWCWVLKNVRALPESVPCRGAQGLWDVPADIAAKILTP